MSKGTLLRNLDQAVGWTPFPLIQPIAVEFFGVSNSNPYSMEIIDTRSNRCLKLVNKKLRRSNFFRYFGFRYSSWNLYY